MQVTQCAILHSVCKRDIATVSARLPNDFFHQIGMIKTHPWKSKDYFLNGFSVKTIVLVGIYNQQFKIKFSFLWSLTSRDMEILTRFTEIHRKANRAAYIFTQKNGSLSWTVFWYRPSRKHFKIILKSTWKAF